MHIAVNGTELWYEVAEASTGESAPTVILVHGGPGGYDHVYLQPLVEPLTAVAHVISLDLRDHGRSARHDPDAWTFEVCSADIAAFADELSIDNPIVLGHSMGGWIAIEYAARYLRRAGGLIAMSTMARFDLDRLTEGFRSMAGDEVAALARRDYSGDEVSDAEWARVFAAFGPRIPGPDEMAGTIKNRAVNGPGMARMRELDVVAELANLTCPTLVVVGALDPGTPVAAAEEILAGLPPGIGRLVVLEDAGHFPWLDVPERLFPLLTGFVSDAASGGAGR